MSGPDDLRRALQVARERIAVLKATLARPHRYSATNVEMRRCIPRRCGGGVETER